MIILIDNGPWISVDKSDGNVFVQITNTGHGGTGFKLSPVQAVTLASILEETAHFAGSAQTSFASVGGSPLTAFDIGNGAA